MTFTHFFPRSERLPYLKKATQTKIVKGLKILDWGGNRGNVLLDGLESGEINPEDYTCIDVDKVVMRQCQSRYPDAKWIIREVWNPAYKTHRAEESESVLQDNTYDIVFSYSVYTHDTYEILLKDLELMYAATKPGGKVCFSIIDPITVKGMIWKRIQTYGEAIPYDTFDDLEDYAYYIDNKTVTKYYDRSKPCEFFITVYNHNWLLNELSSKYNCTVYTPDLSDYDTKKAETLAWQSSIIITKK